MTKEKDQWKSKVSTFVFLLVLLSQGSPYPTLGKLGRKKLEKW